MSLLYVDVPFKMETWIIEQHKSHCVALFNDLNYNYYHRIYYDEVRGFVCIVLWKFINIETDMKRTTVTIILSWNRLTKYYRRREKRTIRIELLRRRFKTMYTTLCDSIRANLTRGGVRVSVHIIHCIMCGIITS